LGGGKEENKKNRVGLMPGKKFFKRQKRGKGETTKRELGFWADRIRSLPVGEKREKSKVSLIWRWMPKTKGRKKGVRTNKVETRDQVNCSRSVQACRRCHKKERAKKETAKLQAASMGAV